MAMLPSTNLGDQNADRKVHHNLCRCDRHAVHTAVDGQGVNWVLVATAIT